MTSLTLRSLGLCIPLVACAAPGSPADAASDATVSLDGRADAATDSADATRVDTAADARPADGAADARTAIDAGTCPELRSRAAPSRQSVRFTVAPGFRGYVVSEGFSCAPFTVAAIDGAPRELALGVGFQCICECPNPGPPRPLSGRGAGSTDGGAPAALAWDAREATVCTTAVDCASRGWPGAGVQYASEAVFYPVAAGRYRATFGVFDEVPMGCDATPEGFACTRSGPMQPPSGLRWGFDRCPATRTVSVEFTVPPSGDVDVMIAAP